MDEIEFQIQCTFAFRVIAIIIYLVLLSISISFSIYTFFYLQKWANIKMLFTMALLFLIHEYTKLILLLTRNLHLKQSMFSIFYHLKFERSWNLLLNVISPIPHIFFFSSSIFTLLLLLPYSHAIGMLIL